MAAEFLGYLRARLASCLEAKELHSHLAKSGCQLLQQAKHMLRSPWTEERWQGWGGEQEQAGTLIPSCQLPPAVSPILACRGRAAGGVVLARSWRAEMVSVPWDIFTPLFVAKVTL